MPTELFCGIRHLADGKGNIFDSAQMQWVAGKEENAVLRAVSLQEAIRWMQKESGAPLRAPVAVIGPREATQEQIDVAYSVGQALAEMGLTVLCGGRQGVMESVCRGVAEKGGISVGLLPDDSYARANPYVTVPVATGIGIARNALISRAALVVIAIGGGLGTLSEIALSLQFGKKVFTLCNAPHVTGARAFTSWEELAPYMFQAILSLEKR